MSASAWDGILRPGEVVVWQGKPHGGFFLEASRQITFFTSAFMCVVGIFMGVAALTAPAGQKNAPDVSFALFSLVFIGGTGALALGQILWPAYKRRHMFYTLTNQRAILGVALPRIARHLESFEIDPTKEYEYRPGPLGSIVFEHRKSWIKVNNRTQYFAVGFMYVARVEVAWDKLQQVQRDMRAHQSKGQTYA